MTGSRVVILSLLLTTATINFADDFVDDLYYQPQGELRKGLTENRPLTLHYNKNVREIIFIDDTASVQYPDTIRAVIKHKNNE